ncbi:hypothetical protein Cgig2_019099 [Carnegiea gigantea]|uniref:Uncharacterized protein n=1 Tax=Carnegiea gigantea TaxID=171969 RepID=A0A9Q1KEC8_9CARY|nr:hypothetical protein Cgig2_019099 [Carnegiea gigantea]
MRNCSLFQSRDPSISYNPSPSTLATRRITYVRDYRKVQDKMATPPIASPTSWRPPDLGLVKLNFDATSFEGIDHGWGFVLQNNDGDIQWHRTKQGSNFLGPETEEISATLPIFSLRQSHHHLNEEHLKMASAVNAEPIPTSSVLMASSKHIGVRCHDQNVAFLKCKKKDGNPEKCLDKGNEVTRCVFGLYASSIPSVHVVSLLRSRAEQEGRE